MKRLAAVLLIVSILSCVFHPAASADENEQGFDWESYTLDELLSIEEELSQVIAEKQRQYAIEHGDRKIIINNNTPNVFVSGTTVLEADVERVLETAPDKTKLLWSSSDNTIATVSETGVVTGVGSGDAIITCRAEDNDLIFAETTVQVLVPVKTISFEKKEESILLFEGQDCGVQLSCAISPEDAFCRDLMWTSSNESIAQVDENGYVSALAPGKVSITATSMDTSSNKAKTASCSITVIQAASSIAVNQNEVIIDKGSACSLSATILPENATSKSVLWTSSDDNVASVHHGLVKGLTCGDAIITARTTDGSNVSAECRVHVVQMVTGIRIAESSRTITLNHGSKQVLSAEITPNTATNPSVEWESSDSSVVSVSKEGEVTAVKGGTATITCKAADGSNKQASIEVYVPSITVEKDSYQITSKDGLKISVFFYGGKEEFKYSISPANIVKETVSWSNNDEKVTLNLEPQAAGTVTILLENKNDSKSSKRITVQILKDAVPNVTDTKAWADWKNSQFSGWSGKHYDFEKLIIKNLNDEKSYKHIDTSFIEVTNEEIRDVINDTLKNVGSKYRVEIGDIFIITEFTAKNAFNATVKNTAYGISQYATNRIILVRIE